jgi:type VI secretion system protein ImpH
MAAADGRERDSVNRALFKAAYRFDFFQAVRLLEHRLREQERNLEKRAHESLREGRGVGRDLHPRDEAVRFRAHPSLSFPAGTISEVRRVPLSPDAPSGAHPPEMVVTFLGLTGPSGVLPRHYTELMLQRIREKDFALRDFLDLFNHRLISLFYRAWEKYRWPIAWERSQLDDPVGELDPATGGLSSLIGLGSPGLRGRLEADDRVFLYYSGHFAHFPRSAIALESLLADHLEMPVRVLQCQGQWLHLDPDDQARMPASLDPEGRNNQLGVNLVVGERVWELQSKFRLRVGPLTWRQFRSLMPNGRSLRPLCQITRMYVGPALDFDVQPVLKPEEVPRYQLTSDTEDGPFLGWNTWMPLSVTAPALPVDDAVFQIEAV